MLKRLTYCLVFLICIQLQAQNDYSKYRFFDSGYIDFSTKNIQIVNKKKFELPWLYQGKSDSVSYFPYGFDLLNRYSFIQDTAGELRYYADFSGVYSNRSGVLFKSYLMNSLSYDADYFGWYGYYKIPNTKVNNGVRYGRFPNVSRGSDSFENHGFTNCVRFGKTQQYGVGIWDYRNNGFRLLRLQYSESAGDSIVGSQIIPNASKLTSFTCGPDDSTFWIVSLMKNMHTMNVYHWAFNQLTLTQSFELGDTSNIFQYPIRMVFSPDNSKMVLLKKALILSRLGKYDKPSYLFDFDAKNGIISNKSNLNFFGDKISFSPNSKLLYVLGYMERYPWKFIDSICSTDTGFENFLAASGHYSFMHYRVYIYDLLSDSLCKTIDTRPQRASYRNLQILHDGNIYLGVDNVSALSDQKYTFYRLENSNDTGNVEFVKMKTNIDYDVLSNRITKDKLHSFLCSEILTCKCFEPEQKYIANQSCFSDTLFLRNSYKKYDSIEINWGDGTNNVFKNLDSTFHHFYGNNGKYTIITNYKSAFQDFTQSDTVTYVKKNLEIIPDDTLVCPSTSLEIDFNQIDSNVVWTATNESKNTFSNPGIYLYQFKENWCDFKDSINVQKRVQPWKLPFHDTAICEGNQVVIKAPKNIALQWGGNPADTNRVKKIISTGDYDVRFSDSFCRFYDTVSVYIVPRLTLEIAQVDTLGCHVFTPLEFQIGGETSKLKTVSWNEQVTNSANYFTNSLNEIRMVAIDSYGCMEKLTILPKSSCVSRVFIPNAFTPNAFGPAANEHFKPVVTDGVITRFAIYNRWGKLIFDDFTGDGWDGKMDNQDAPEGVYVYEIEVKTVFKNEKFSNRFSGNFQLIR